MPPKNAHCANTPASQQTLPHLNEEQQNELFNVQKRKAELELQALEEETQARQICVEQEFEDCNNRLVRKRATYAQEQEDRKTRLEREKLLYEAQLQTATTGPPAAPSTTAREELQEGETPLEALAISKKFPSLLHSQIALIFLNKFKLKNLHKLRCRGDINKDLEEDITLLGGRLQVK